MAKSSDFNTARPQASFSLLPKPIRFFFMLIAFIAAGSFTHNFYSGDSIFEQALLVVAACTVLALLLFSLEKLLLKTSLKNFNLLFLSVLLGSWVASVMSSTLLLVIAEPSQLIISYLPVIALIFSVFASSILIFNAKDSIYLSIPFIELQKNQQKTRKIIPDLTTLSDSRFYELALSGLIDQRLSVPSFFLTSLKTSKEMLDEPNSKSKLALDNLKKLEALPFLEISFPEIEHDPALDLQSQLQKYIKSEQGILLTVEANKAQSAELEGIRAISLNQLSNSFKPLAISRDTLSIKIQRYGKEPLQGVGYLDDGTMVVVNGGADYIGETIKASVLSMKQTSSGRMIFCNALYESEDEIEGTASRQPHFALND